MKKNSVMKLMGSLLIATALSLPGVVSAQNSKDQKIISDAEEAKAEFISKDGLLQNLFANSYGYVIFPNVGKGAIGVGGAAGNGIVYQGGSMIGKAKMKQVSVGFQFGGQAYREIGGQKFDFTPF
jgi:lipid-binding SYLF domain-containing protein